VGYAIAPLCAQSGTAPRSSAKTLSKRTGIGM
jgi:hypothetical protein